MVSILPFALHLSKICSRRSLLYTNNGLNHVARANSRISTLAVAPSSSLSSSHRIFNSVIMLSITVCSGTPATVQLFECISRCGAFDGAWILTGVALFLDAAKSCHSNCSSSLLTLLYFPLPKAQAPAFSLYFTTMVNFFLGRVAHPVDCVLPLPRHLEDSRLKRNAPGYWRYSMKRYTTYMRRNKPDSLL